MKKELKDPLECLAITLIMTTIVLAYAAFIIYLVLIMINEWGGFSYEPCIINWIISYCF